MTSREVRRSIGQPFATIPTIPLTSMKMPMPPTTIHTAMRAGVIFEPAPGGRGGVEVTPER